MKIQITSSSGQGNTKLSAFDNALFNARIANFNLIKLSSVIPPKSLITDLPKKIYPEGEWGDKLYVVMAEAVSDVPGESVWAAIGWVQDKKTGKGLFVEHSGSSREKVQKEVNLSLGSLLKTRNMKAPKIQMQLSSAKCINKPVCALVAAIYESRGWKD